MADPIIVPVYEQTPSGGGSEALAAAEAYYFTSAEIHEEIEEETANE